MLDPTVITWVAMALMLLGDAASADAAIGAGLRRFPDHIDLNHMRLQRSYETWAAASDAQSAIYSHLPSNFEVPASTAKQAASLLRIPTASG